MKNHKYALNRFAIYKKLKKYVTSYGNYYDPYNKCKMTLNDLSKKIQRCPKQTRKLVREYLALNDKDNINSFITHGNVGNENQNHYSKETKIKLYEAYQNYLIESKVGDTIIQAP